MNPNSFNHLPAGDLISQGLADLTGGLETAEALLVSIGSPRLRRLGLSVPDTIARPELKLYELLSRQNSNAAHSRYNGLVRRLVSFERALGCAR